MSNGNGVTENGTAADISNGRQQNGAGDADVMRPAAKKRKTRLPVDLELDYVLGDMPKKVSVESIDNPCIWLSRFYSFQLGNFFLSSRVLFHIFAGTPGCSKMKTVCKQD